MMPTAIPPAAITRARKLRRDMTDGERKLWSELREFRHLYGVHVRKQAPIGPYIADFVIHAKSLVIEVDGEHHCLPGQMHRDATRDEWFVSQGYKVLRLTTADLSDAFEGCIEEILAELGLMEDAP